MRTLIVTLCVLSLSYIGNAQAYNSSITIDDSKHYPNHMLIAGRDMVCHGAKVLEDYDIPSEGAAASTDILLINPRMMNHQPKKVRWFVFAHECSHLRRDVQDSERKADHFAVVRGVNEGWLDEEGLKQVCASFDDAPSDGVHPSGRDRCRENAQWHKEALAAKKTADDKVVVTPHVVTPAPPKAQMPQTWFGRMRQLFNTFPV